VQALDLDDFAPIVDDFGESAFGGYNSIAVSPEGLVVAVSPVDFDVFAPSVTPMGEIEGWTPIDVTDPPTASAIAFIDGGRRLVAADPAGLISVIRAGWIDDVGTLVDPPGPGLVTVDPTGDTLAIWGRMRGVQLYDRATLDHTGALAIEPDRSLVGVGFDPDGKRIVTMTCPFDADPCPAELSVWDVDAGRPIAGPVEAGDVWAGASLGAAFTGDGQMVATAGSTGVQLWDARSLDPIGERLALDDVAPFAGDDVRALATGSADERSLLVANGGLGEAVAWELTDEDVRPIGFIDAGVSDVGFAPDGLLIVAQGPGTVQFHDPFTLQPVGAPFVSDVPAFAFRFSQAGTMVSTGTFGSMVWDIASREPLTGMIPSSFADVSPDGKIVYLGAAGFPEIPSGAVVRALSLERDDIVEEACRQAGRNLTRDEWDRQLPEDADYGPTCPEWPMPDTG
jgi:WD40 repeat protein